MKDKEVAIETITNLPENVSMDEIAEQLQIMAAIRKGKEDVTAGRVKSGAVCCSLTSVSLIKISILDVYTYFLDRLRRQYCSAS